MQFPQLSSKSQQGLVHGAHAEVVTVIVLEGELTHVPSNAVTL